MVRIESKFGETEFFRYVHSCQKWKRLENSQQGLLYEIGIILNNLLIDAFLTSSKNKTLYKNNGCIDSLM